MHRDVFGIKSNEYEREYAAREREKCAARGFTGVVEDVGKRRRRGGINGKPEWLIISNIYYARVCSRKL